MAIDINKYMTKDEQKALIEGNLKAWAQDYMAHQLTTKISVDADVVAKAEGNMATIESAFVIAEAELALLDVPVVE